MSYSGRGRRQPARTLATFQLRSFGLACFSSADGWSPPSSLAALLAKCRLRRSALKRSYVKSSAMLALYVKDLGRQ